MCYWSYVIYSKKNWRPKAKPKKQTITFYYKKQCNEINKNWSTSIIEQIRNSYGKSMNLLHFDIVTLLLNNNNNIIHYTFC